jgi:hypothetical protein
LNFHGLHVMSESTAVFITTAVRTSHFGFFIGTR